MQRSQQYYAHIVLSIEHDYHAKEQKYWIGNIEQRVNGWCFREHIYGTLVDVQTEWHGAVLQSLIAEKRVPAGAEYAQGQPLEPTGADSLPADVGLIWL